MMVTAIGTASAAKRGIATAATAMMAVIVATANGGSGGADARAERRSATRVPVGGAVFR